ncbi:MAG: hypothetical protein FJW20_14710 [Acidimicrobiia bacterium]|nr:hypothetical protein [Acidimicrobiia bacterium]
MPNTSKADQTNRPLERSSAPSSDAGALENLLEQWMQGDEQEQCETFELLKQRLDEDRLPGYKLFS